MKTKISTDELRARYATIKELVRSSDLFPTMSTKWGRGREFDTFGTHDDDRLFYSTLTVTFELEHKDERYHATTDACIYVKMEGAAGRTSFVDERGDRWCVNEPVVNVNWGGHGLLPSDVAHEFTYFHYRVARLASLIEAHLGDVEVWELLDTREDIEKAAAKLAAEKKMKSLQEIVAVAVKGRGLRRGNKCHCSPAADAVLPDDIRGGVQVALGGKTFDCWYDDRLSLLEITRLS